MNTPKTKDPSGWMLMRAQSKYYIGAPTTAQFECVKEFHAAIDAHPNKDPALRERIAGAAYWKARAAGLSPYDANIAACWALLAVLDKLCDPQRQQLQAAITR